MRLVSELREVEGNTTMLGKHMQLRVRQNHFTIGDPNKDIMLLDYVATSCGKILRSIIMSIQSLVDLPPPGNLFHTVG